MAISTSTKLSLVEEIAKSAGDYLTFDTTTNITTTTAIVSTALNQYDDAKNGIFDGWWVYFNTTANPTVERRTGLNAGKTTYATATGTLTAGGANFSVESATTTCYLFRYKRSHYVDAIDEAIKEIYPTLHKRVDDQTLITGNILPDAHFESWSSASALTWYSTSDVTLARTSTAGLTRGGYYSVKASAGADNGYFYISSDTYPRLLDLQGRSVDFYCQAYPLAADGANIEIYTVSNDGSTTQTLTSTTSNPAGVFTKLELENQAINEDLEEIQIRFRVKTSGSYNYFDDAYLNGMSLDEYLLPDDLITGHLSQVYIQGAGNSDLAFYDLHCFNSAKSKQVKFNTISDGSNQYLKLDDMPASGYRMRLIGINQLESLSADTDTITLSAEKVPLLLAKAREIFWMREAQYHNLTDNTRFLTEMAKAQAEYVRLMPLRRMNTPQELR
jgi:hypothetical protein